MSEESEIFIMGIIMCNTDFKVLAKKTNEAIARGEDCELPLVKNPVPMREVLRRIDSGEFKGSFDYLGGYEQLKKDVESGMYDDEK
jgi:hypothetical protein